MIDPRLVLCASPLQLQALEAVETHGSARAAARALGIHHKSVLDRIARAKAKAALTGWHPETHDTRPCSPAHYVKGSSKLYRRGEEEPVLEWVKTSARDEDRLALFREAVEIMAADFKGLAPPVAAPAHTDTDLHCVIPMGDPHIGQHSWGVETHGPDYDLPTAEHELFGCVDRLVAKAPPAGRCTIISLGDLFHADDSSNQTPASKHVLDVDTRYPKVVATGLRVMRRIVERAAEHFGLVDLWLLPGNHDPHVSVMLAIAMAAIYEQDRRVKVSTDPATLQVTTHGQCLIAATHGHAIRPPRMAGTVAARHPAEWGSTRHRHGYVGHVHHDSLREDPGMLIETVRTTAPKDAYAAGQGYESGRDMKLDTYHVEKGRISRIIETP